MIVRRLREIEGTERDVDAGPWQSRRFLLASDGLAFGLHDTLVHAGAELEMCYLHHVEAVYCVGGRGSVQALPDGERHVIEDGTILRARRTRAPRRPRRDRTALGVRVRPAAHGARDTRRRRRLPCVARVGSGLDAEGGPVTGDPYPSRTVPRPMWIDRREPTVWGTAARGPLSRRELDDYDRDGLAFFPSLFDTALVGELRAELDRLVEQARSGGGVVREPSGRSVRSLFAVHETSAIVARVASHPHIVERAEQILGGAVYIHQSRVNYKPAFDGAGFYWHSDFETWHQEDGIPAMRALSCSIAVTDPHPHNGALMLVPGSHRTFVACVGETPPDHYKGSLVRQEVGTPDRASIASLVRARGIEAPRGPAGSALFFDCNVLHGSHDNITPWPRTHLFLVFNSEENRPVAPFSGRPPRPGFLGTRG